MSNMPNKLILDLAAIPTGTYLGTKLRKDIADKIANVCKKQRIPHVEPLLMHATIWNTNLPNFKVVLQKRSYLVEKETYALTYLGYNSNSLVLKFNNVVFEGRRNQLNNAEKIFAEKNGWHLDRLPYTAHLTVSESKLRALSSQDLTDLTAIFQVEVGDLVFEPEFTNLLYLPNNRAPRRKMTLNDAQRNRQRLEKSSHVTIRPQREYAPDLLKLNPEDLQKRLDSLYARRRVAGLAGQGRTVQYLNRIIARLRDVHGMIADMTTQPKYVGFDRTDPLGGTMTEQAALRGSKKIVDLLIKDNVDKVPTLNVKFDLDWSKQVTVKGLNDVLRILSPLGYVLTRTSEGDGRHCYNFSLPDKSECWSFVTNSGRDWCFEVRHNGNIVAGTFVITPGVDIDMQGIPACMQDPNWDGTFNVTDSGRYNIAWRNMLSMIRTYAVNKRPRSINNREKL